MTSNAPGVRQTIVQLLSHMRDGKEIREYLHRFSGIDQERFAVIKVGGAVIQDDLQGLASALAFPMPWLPPKTAVVVPARVGTLGVEGKAVAMSAKVRE